jgi:sugar phosphate isomerase/epimerase
MIELGIKSDPILYRYSYEWLFKLLAEEGISKVQLGTFFEIYQLDDDYFKRLSDLAQKYGVHIKSIFTAHRELGGFFHPDASFTKVARKNYERLIRIGEILGSDYVGSNPGAVFRDLGESKAAGTENYLNHMKELSFLAKSSGLKALTIEPMSSLYEPPSTPQEIDFYMRTLMDHHQANADRTVPTYLCGDMTHGVADADKKVLFSNMELFEHGLPYSVEFHFKNTDAIYNSTFGFGESEMAKGIIKLDDIRDLLDEKEASFPMGEMTGYLEIGGPKLGRDYSDLHLSEALRESLRAMKNTFCSALA